MKIAATVCLILGAFPLIAYPAVIVADVMALSAAGGNLTLPASLPEWLNAYVMLGATLYPVVWLTALVNAIFRIRRGSEASAFRFSLLPLAFLASLPLAFALSQAMHR